MLRRRSTTDQTPRTTRSAVAASYPAAASVARAPATDAVPRCYLWSHVPGDSPLLGAIRTDPTVAPLTVTGQYGIYDYLPQTGGAPYSVEGYTPPASAPLPLDDGDSEINRLADHMAVNILHNLHFSGQIVEDESRDDADGLIHIAGLGNLRFKPDGGGGFEAWPDLAPVIGDPSDAIHTGTYALPGQAKPASLNPDTDAGTIARGRFSIFHATATDRLLRLYRRVFAKVEEGRLAYRPPGAPESVPPVRLRRPLGMALDVERQLDPRLFHQIQYINGYVRLSDLREMFDAALPDGTATDRAATEKVLYGKDGQELTLDEWWQTEVVGRGLWLDTKVLPIDALFNEEGSPILHLGYAVDMLANAAQEHALKNSVVRAFEETWGTCRWGNYNQCFPKDPDALVFPSASSRFPVVTFSSVVAYSYDDKAVGAVDAKTDLVRLAEIDANLDHHDRDQPALAWVACPRADDATLESWGRGPFFLETLKRCYRAGIREFAIWNEDTAGSPNADISSFYPWWLEFLGWAAAQAGAGSGDEEPETAGMGARFRFQRGLSRRYGVRRSLFTAPAPAAPPPPRVLIDDGLAVGMLTAILTQNLAAMPEASGRGGLVEVIAFGEAPRSDQLRTARIGDYRLVQRSRVNAGGHADHATLVVPIVCVVDAGKDGAKSAHAAAEVAALVRWALDGQGMRVGEHILNVQGIDRDYATPDEDKLLQVAIVTVTAMVTRDALDAVTPQGVGT